MNNLTIKTRLIAVITFLSVLLIVIGTYGLWGMSRSNEGLRTVYEDRTIALGQLDQVVRRLLNNRLDIANSLVDTSDENVKKLTDDIDENIVIINKNWDAYMASYLTPEEKKLADQFVEDRKKFVMEGIRPAQAALRKHDFKLANEIRSAKIIPLYPAVREGLNSLIKLQLDIAKEEYEQATARFSMARNVSISLILLGVTLSALMGFMLVRGIGRGLASAIEVADKMAAGDLTTSINDGQKDEIGKLLSAMKAMQSSMQTLISDIQTSADVINTASKEIAAGNSDLSQRTEEQASSLEETASSMEELTSTVKQNAENAKQANQLAIGASDVAGKGGAVVSQVVTTMDSINESSRKIVDIISVIDGIAFQTNILALNAAVEAARAGEQGRGFAVVAAEVRNLAQRSAAAAKEIKTLIGDSVDKVEGGSKLVAQAGQTMGEIVTSIRRVTDIMSEITAASQEQSQGIEQVNTAITQMDEVTQQNAALVEQAAAAAESLEEQAQALSASVATFKVDSNATQVVATRTAPRQVAAPARKAISAPAAKPSKSTAMARPKAKSGDDGEWQEF